MASNDERESASARGYGHRWRKERAAFLALNPWCALKGDGCGMLASVVDHKVPHRGDQTLFWDSGNWQSLCAHCHSMHKQRLEAVALGPLRDCRGRLILGQ